MVRKTSEKATPSEKQFIPVERKKSVDNYDKFGHADKKT